MNHTQRPKTRRGGVTKRYTMNQEVLRTLSNERLLDNLARSSISIMYLLGTNGSPEPCWKRSGRAASATLADEMAMTVHCTSDFILPATDVRKRNQGTIENSRRLAYILSSHIREEAEYWKFEAWIRLETRYGEYGQSGCQDTMVWEGV